MSGYAAIVTRKPFELQRKTAVGKTPYWAAASEDGKHCFVSVAGEDLPKEPLPAWAGRAGIVGDCGGECDEIRPAASAQLVRGPCAARG